MVMWAHLGPFICLNLFLKQWNVLLNGPLGNMQTTMVKYHSMQHAYSGMKGTDTALLTIVNMIKSLILRDKFCLVISVNIKGAFENLATLAI